MYFDLRVIIIAGIALVVMLLFFFELYFRNRRHIVRTIDASLTCEELEEHARKLAIDHVVSRKTLLSNWPVPGMNDNFSFITSVYEELNEEVRKKRSVPPAAEWLLDNFYILEEQVKIIRQELKREEYLRLPVLKCGPMKSMARIHVIAMELVAHTEGQIDERIISDFLKAYQSNSVLLDRELCAMPVMIRLALIDNIRSICEKIRDTHIKWRKADEIADSMLKSESPDEDFFQKILKENLLSSHDISLSFVEHLSYRLRRGGREFSSLLRHIDAALARHAITLDDITQREHNTQATYAVLVGNGIVSLKFISTMDWVDVFEISSHVNKILSEDPDGTYTLMDLPSRDYYRSKIECLASQYKISEIHVAQKAIELARKAWQEQESNKVSVGIDPTELFGDCFAYTTNNSGLTEPQDSQCHVGYYLAGKGVAKLLKSLGQNPDRAVCRSPGSNTFTPSLYFTSIGVLTLAIAVLIALYSYSRAYAHNMTLTVLAGIISLIPASEVAIFVTNRISCRLVKPYVFPRLEFKDAIPEKYSTMIVIPALLPDENRTADLVQNLETHYHANRGTNLYFALAGDFKDSPEPELPGDNLIIQTALKGIKELNKKYSTDGVDIFYYFHRHRQFNPSQNKWMGWERKRGALVEFNDLLLGSMDTSYSITSGSLPPDVDIKYVITLDADTIMPIGAAKKLIGTMAHPLNRPVTHPRKNIVIEGYGLVQPRIIFNMDSSNKTLFSRIFTGQEGIDPYSGAVSDVYQDIFGEGIFTGKGIYHLEIFQKILKDVIPDNAILSHDLIEGCFIRAGLATDIELVDSYPSSYSSFCARLHRWVRGDWQLVPWLGKYIRSKNGNTVKNPISTISRWKIADNMRRSVLTPILFLQVILGLTVFPGIIPWVLIPLIVLGLPFIGSVIGYLMSKPFTPYKIKQYQPVISGIKAAFLQAVLMYTFLPYQAYLMSHAIIITLVRVFFSKKDMLEWVTAADVEKRQKNTLESYWSKMKASPIQAAALLLLTFIFKPDFAGIGILLALLWGIAPYIAYTISKTVVKEHIHISEEDMAQLRRIARKTWGYFEEFANHENNYLPPDNYQEEPPNGVAHRTSPTNIGLGLLAALSARDLGYISTCEMVDIISNAVSSMEKMEKWNGHLYNWYDTRTLKPLRPRYISTVDSGNLVCYLMTLVQGLYEILKRPLFDEKYITGLKDTIYLIAGDTSLNSENGDLTVKDAKQPVNIEAFNILAGETDMPVLLWWNSSLDELSKKLIEAGPKKSRWKSKSLHAVSMMKKELHELAPWIEKTAGLSRENPYIRVMHNLADKNPRLIDLQNVYEEFLYNLEGIIGQTSNTRNTDKNEEVEKILLELRDTLEDSLNRIRNFIARYKELAERINQLSGATSFKPLYAEKKQLFSIGYNIEENRLTNSYYDLLASEARQTSYIAIARGEITPRHWFKLGRTVTVVDYYKGLVSWTGTMFEYLMPLIIMKSYKNTLLDETYSFAVRSQKKYGRQRRIPWGASESGFYSMDINLDYQYKAIGVPWLGLKRGLMEDAVTAPYASFLSLPIDPEAVMENIKKLKAEGLDGPYGYYEAVDYTPERIPFGEKRAIVRSFMAHHQGMSLLALNNYINKNVLQKCFHSDPAVKAAELLLQEKVPVNLVLTTGTKEKAAPFKTVAFKERGNLRRFKSPDTVLPRVHMLSNGRYTVMITDRGTGYSISKGTAVTRWREDVSLDNYGIFFYIHDISNDRVWSSSHAPLDAMPDKFEGLFAPDRARFKRLDGDIETETEITAAPGDNVEIRRISLKNIGSTDKTIEITSYYELVLSPQGADVAHPAFNKLFVRTEFLQDYMSLAAVRRPRTESDREVWAFNTPVVEGEIIGGMEYETDRMQFIGRGNTVANPAALNCGKPLSGTTGSVLDPVMSTRFRLNIKPDQTVRISYIIGTTDSYESMLTLIEKYSHPESVENAFRLALTRSQVEARYLNIKASEVDIFQDMLSHIHFISPLRKQKSEYIEKNKKGQSALWTYGISGDLPIVLVSLKSTDETDIVYEALKAHEYWSIKGLKIDMVILNEEETSYTHPLSSLLKDAVGSSHAHSLINKPGGIYILNKNNIAGEDLPLLYAVSRIALKGDGGPISQQLIAAARKHISDFKHYDDCTENKHFDDYTGSPAYVRHAPFERVLQFFNELGGFSPDGTEYIIRLEKGQNTPTPWVNVICNPNFGFIASESGTVYTWCENSRENKLTPWSNDPVSNIPGEVVYLSDEKTGLTWTVTPLPVREEEPYVITHGFGYTSFEHTSHGIEQSMVQFVPIGENVKLSIVRLKNLTQHNRHIALTYYMRPVLGVSDQITAMHIKTQIGEENILLIENPYNDEFPGRIAFLDVSEKDRSVTGDRKEFFGACSKPPKGLRLQKLSGSAGTGFDPCAAMQVSIILEPGKEKNIVFLMGMGKNLQEVSSISSKYRNTGNVEKALANAKKFWNDKLSAINVKTPDEPFNIMLNGWLMYQVIACRIWARSSFYQSGGAFGFRDQLQDSLAAACIWPEITRSQILLHAAHQFIEGDVQHWWHEPQNKGTRTRFSDDLLWLPYTTAEYIDITGDMGILEVSVPFLQDEPLHEYEDERYSKPAVSAQSASVYEHCIRAIEYSLKFGEHGLPLMGSGDWNDGMNTVGNKGKGESVWLGWFLYSTLEKFMPLCITRGDEKRAQHYLDIINRLKQAIEENAWDGSWYRRAYFDNGLPLGSIQNSECKIDSISQTWAVLSGAGDKKRVKIAMDSLENYLVNKDEGIVKLLTPPFDSSDLTPGYIKSYVPGVRENGGQYTHAAAWVIIAFAKMLNGDKAWEIFELINPINHTRTPMEYAKYKAEPYVMSADVYAAHPHSGRGGWTWYTGSAGWVYKAGLEYILGIRRKGDNLIMNPCIPKKWNGFSISYRYMDTTYEIKINNPEGVNSGVKSIVVDGKPTKNVHIKLIDDKITHYVEVTLG